MSNTVQEKNESIFQIWDRLGRKTPFLVKRKHWPAEDFVVIERVECEAIAHFKAFGYPVSSGERSQHFRENLSWRRDKLIPMAEALSWVVVIANYSELITEPGASLSAGSI